MAVLPLIREFKGKQLAMNDKIFVVDTTLRDGAQSANISFSVEDKVKILNLLDSVGVDFAEAGYPAAQQKDSELFERIKSGAVRFEHLKPIAFAATCREGKRACEDVDFCRAIELCDEYLTVCGKASDEQVFDILKTTLDENLRMIKDSVSYAVSRGKRVIFDCEHFFDGFIHNEQYAMSAAKAAAEAGAECIVLCDTNGGMMPEQIKVIVSRVKREVGCRIGIHCHNDSGLAVANTIAAVNYGASDIQGTFCGIGERCGNTNLCTVIPDLQIKLGYNLLPRQKLRMLAPTARAIADIANILFDERSPYVGKYAFSHKAGSHIDGETKAIRAFEHCDPSDVGNGTHLLISEQSGRSAVRARIAAMYPGITRDDKRVAAVLERIKSAEYRGCQYEDADGSLELLIAEEFGQRKSFFDIVDFKIMLGNPSIDAIQSCVVLKLRVGDDFVFAAAEGDGPVNAMDKALRDGLKRFYPELSGMRLVDYKVRVIDSSAATAALVRVSIESADDRHSWRTVGVSTDLIKASWRALCDSVEYKLSMHK